MSVTSKEGSFTRLISIFTGPATGTPIIGPAPLAVADTHSSACTEAVAIVLENNWAVILPLPCCTAFKGMINAPSELRAYTESPTFSLESEENGIPSAGFSTRDRDLPVYRESTTAQEVA